MKETTATTVTNETSATTTITHLEVLVDTLKKSRLLASLRDKDEKFTSGLLAAHLASTFKALAQADEGYNWPGFTLEEAKAAFLAVVVDSVDKVESVWDTAGATDHVRSQWTGINTEMLADEIPSKMAPSLWFKKVPWAKHLAGVADAAAESSALDDPKLVWVHKMGAFVGKDDDGSFNVETPMKKDAAKMWLIDKSAMRSEIAVKMIQGGKLPMVDSFAPNNKAPAFFEENERRYVNSYRPVELQPASGQWPRIFEVLWMITGGSEDPVEAKRALDYLFNMIAAKVQAPCVRRGVALIFTGPQGCGKTAAGDWVRAMVGMRNSTAINGVDLKDTFTSRYVDKLFINASEVSQDNGGDRIQTADKLKSLITDYEVTHSAPHANRVPIINRVMLWMSANHAVPVKMEGVEERRYTVFTAPWKRAERGTPYYEMVAGMYDPQTKQLTESAQAELQAFYADVLEYQVDWNLASVPFENHARTALVIANRAAHDEFMDEVVAGGAEYVQALWDRYKSCQPLGSVPVEWSVEDHVTVQALYGAYRQACEDRGVGKKNQSNFAAEWNKRLGDTYPLEHASRKNRKVVAKGLQVNGLGGKNVIPFAQAAAQASGDVY
jgi:hypothetical protein